MPQYLVTIQRIHDFDLPKVDEAMIRDIDLLNQELDAAGVTTFACKPSETAAQVPPWEQ